MILAIFPNGIPEKNLHIYFPKCDGNYDLLQLIQFL